MVENSDTTIGYMPSDRVMRTGVGKWRFVEEVPNVVLFYPIGTQ